MELINDERLTPSMDSVRSGSTQLFREKNPSDRTFIGLENCNLMLRHDNKSMYAELIEGKWYWISGCNQCNGKPRGYSYVECDKHDVCRCCGISRKEVKDVWGGSKGWTCNPCREAEDLERRRQAFEKLDGEEPDTYSTDEIICPHCGSKVYGEDVHRSQDMECGVCEGEFEVEVEYTATYSTTVKGKRITK